MQFFETVRHILAPGHVLNKLQWFFLTVIFVYLLKILVFPNHSIISRDVYIKWCWNHRSKILNGLIAMTVYVKKIMIQKSHTKKKLKWYNLLLIWKWRSKAQENWYTDGIWPSCDIIWSQFTVFTFWIQKLHYSFENSRYSCIQKGHFYQPVRLIYYWSFGLIILNSQCSDFWNSLRIQ